MRSINEIFIHCTATQPDWMRGRLLDAKVAEIDRWHRERGFTNGFGYHYLIDRDGALATGRPEEMVGAHVQGHNAHSIGVVLVGGHGSAATDAFESNFTPTQDRRLRDLLRALKTKYPDAVIRGHNEVANKACPGFNVHDWLVNNDRPIPGHVPAVVPEAAVTVPTRTSPRQSRTMQASGVIAMASAAGPVIASASGVPWQNLVVLSVVALIALVATGVVSAERLRKWRKGDR